MTQTPVLPLSFTKQRYRLAYFVKKATALQNEVPVHDVVPVQVLEGVCGLRSVEDGHVLVKEAVDVQEGLHVPTDHVLHHLQETSLSLQ